MRILLTGVAGFIGFHCARRLLSEGHQILGYDNINDYYDPRHKHARLRLLGEKTNFSFIKGDLSDASLLERSWESFKPERILHLAAQAGVRYSLENPMAYIHSNITGFQNVIDLVRKFRPENFVYASSSSVYGGISELPFSEKQTVNQPLSLYAATKLENELVAHCYSHLYDTPSTGLRFFTVYGPYARPDMAMYKFATLMKKGAAIPVYNHGDMVRDFTFIDDIVSGIIGALNKAQKAKVYNLGRGKPMRLSEMIGLLEENLSMEAKKEYLPIQDGDVPATVADVSLAGKELGYAPKVDLREGVAQFCAWFKMQDQGQNQNQRQS